MAAADNGHLALVDWLLTQPTVIRDSLDRDDYGRSFQCLAVAKAHTVDAAESVRFQRARELIKQSKKSLSLGDFTPLHSSLHSRFFDRHFRPESQLFRLWHPQFSHNRGIRLEMDDGGKALNDCDSCASVFHAHGVTHIPKWDWKGRDTFKSWTAESGYVYHDQKSFDNLEKSDDEQSEQGQ